MLLTVVSSDLEIAALCREIIGEYPEQRWELNATLPNSGHVSENSSLCLIDFHPGVALPVSAGWGRTHFVLVGRQDLASFQDEHPETAGSILLKPVTRPTLRTIFSRLATSQDCDTKQGSLRVDRDELLQCLIQANLKLQEYDQERTNFLTRAVHDFRAPVTALSGYCGLLLEGQLGSLTAPQREVLGRMLNSSKRLARMTNAMFQLSVSRHLDQRPNVRPADIRECLEQALHELNQFTEEKRIEVGVDMAPPGGVLCFEPAQIEQLLVNLLDNACKFTPRNGWIDIKGYPYFWDRRSSNLRRQVDDDRRARASQEPNAYRVDIQDSGSGIRPEHLDSIFEDYISYSGVEDRAGAGLGLAICRMIVTQHGGKIWAQGRSEGASFSFVLPRFRESAPPPVRPPEWQSNALP